MSKRNLVEDEMSLSDDDDDDIKDGGSDNQSVSDQEVEVDFDFFDPQPRDEEALVTLLRQSFGSDHSLFNLLDLAQAIVQQPLVGTTVKTETANSDPFLILTVLNVTLAHSQARIWANELMQYLLGKSPTNQAVKQILSQSMANGGGLQLGWIISERLMNMPPQVTGPAYEMLMEEVDWALEENEPYQFDWWMLLAKIYKQVPSSTDWELSDEPIRAKAKKNKLEESLYYMQPEEEIIQSFATHWLDFEYTRPPTEADSKRLFQESGIVPLKRLFLVRGDQMKPLAEAIKKAFSS